MGATAKRYDGRQEPSNKHLLLRQKRVDGSQVDQSGGNGSWGFELLLGVSVSRRTRRSEALALKIP
jgi:hypothetical protein